jgi:hypothetical protein
VSTYANLRADTMDECSVSVLDHLLGKVSKEHASPD